MITVTEVGVNEPGLPPSVKIEVVGLTDIKRIRRLVDRALNCDPDAGEDLFAMADDLERIVQTHST